MRILDVTSVDRRGRQLGRGDEMLPLWNAVSGNEKRQFIKKSVKQKKTITKKHADILYDEEKQKAKGTKANE